MVAGMTDSTRTVECPHCQGRVTVTDHPIYVEEQAEPVAWAIVRASCAQGCDLMDGDIPNRAA